MRRTIEHLSMLFLASALAACDSTPAPDVGDASDASDTPSIDDLIRDDGCPLLAPTNGGIGGCAFGNTCTYEAVRCHCDSGGWQCDPIECPTTGVVTGASCPRIGLTCGRYFEGACDCVGPERVWNCCGGTTCNRFPVEGSLCCPADNYFCHSWQDGGVTIHASCSNEHWSGVTYTVDDAGDAEASNDAGSADAFDATAIE